MSMDVWYGFETKLVKEDCERLLKRNDTSEVQNNKSYKTKSFLIYWMQYKRENNNIKTYLTELSEEDGQDEDVGWNAKMG